MLLSGLLLVVVVVVIEVVVVLLALLALASLLFVSATYSQEVVYGVQPLIIGYRVVPYQVIQVQPAPPLQLVVPPPVKPNFKTPIRDGMYYGTYYSRLWRWNRLNGLLGVQPVVPQQQ
jgi:hypothetical protein